MGLIPLVVVVLTYDEEVNLAGALASVEGWVGRMVVVDSGSSDSTVTIARGYGAQVLAHPFETHARQWEWALANLPEEAEWVLGLDADQRVTAELRDELIRMFTEGQSRLEQVDGFYVKRRQIFRGKWIRHGTYYPKYLLKLFRRGQVRLDERDLMDHHFYVDGATAKLEQDIVEANRKEDDIAFWIEKHNRYARLQAQEELLRRNGRAWPLQPRLAGSPDERVIWLKQRWYRMPLYVRPVLYYVYRYFLRLGFLDGKQGFIFHFLQAFWYRLLVDIHLDDLLQQEAGSRGQKATLRVEGERVGD